MHYDVTALSIDFRYRIIKCWRPNIECQTIFLSFVLSSIRVYLEARGAKFCCVSNLLGLAMIGVLWQISWWLSPTAIADWRHGVRNPLQHRRERVGERWKELGNHCISFSFEINAFVSCTFGNSKQRESFVCWLVRRAGWSWKQTFVLMNFMSRAAVHLLHHYKVLNNVQFCLTRQTWGANVSSEGFVLMKST